MIDNMAEENTSQAVLEDIRQSFQTVASCAEAIKKIKVDKVIDNASILAEAKPYPLHQYEQETITTPPGLKTGWTTLDEILSIPQESITIVAARPSHGKTTFLLNLTRNMLLENEGKTILYFSYEQTCRQIVSRYLAMSSGVIIGGEPYQNIREIEDYIRSGKASNEKLEEAKREYREFSDGKRLWIIDRPFTAPELHICISSIKNECSILAVVVDYIQKIRTSGSGQRYEKLQEVSAQILESARSLKLPFVLGAQLGRDKEHKNKLRLENLRECGDFEQDASLVIGIHNQTMESIQNGGGGSLTEPVDLTIQILKNRDGVVNVERRLEFEGPILQIRDPQPDDFFP